MSISTEELIQKYNTDVEHVMQVKEYCEKLQTSLSGLIEFSDREMEYLKCASLLHDIGYFIEKKSHHKHSFDLIIQHEIDDFSQREVKVIANIARYHRNSLPDETRHQHYAELTEEEKYTVKKLASLLRIADGMDKPHKNLILRIETKETDESYDFYIKTVGFKPNLTSAKEKSDLFEQTFKKPANFYIL